MRPLDGVICSVRHTGTWFVIETLKALGFGSVLPWRHSYEVGGGLAINWLHLHVGGGPDLQPWDPFRYLRTALVDAFVGSDRYPVVVPVRDPLACLISHENRRAYPEGTPAGQPHLHVIDGLAECARWFREVGRKMHVLRTDAPRRDRPREMLAFARFCSDAVPGHTLDEVFAADLAEGWQPQNATPADPSGLRAAYQAGDFGRVARAFPREIRALRERPEIVEMYERLGYELRWLGVAA